jgi:hypothetical protein
MDPIWGCEWCDNGVGTCDCTAPCGSFRCENNFDEDVTEEEFDRMMNEAEEQ